MSRIPLAFWGAGVIALLLGLGAIQHRLGTGAQPTKSDQMAVMRRMQEIYQQSGGRFSRVTAAQWKELQDLRARVGLPPLPDRIDPPPRPSTGDPAKDRMREIGERTGGDAGRLTKEDREFLTKQGVRLP